MRIIVGLFCFALIGLVGCESKVDPKSRPGFVDTSDPGKVGGTMATVPKAGPNKAGKQP
jgi:hypothetical protein